MINNETNEKTTERVLIINGTIAEESWFGDEVTPAEFKEELNSETKGILYSYFSLIRENTREGVYGLIYAQ